MEDQINKLLKELGETLIFFLPIQLKGFIGKSDKFAAFTNKTFSIFKKTKRQKYSIWLTLSGIDIKSGAVTLNFAKQSYPIIPKNQSQFLAFVFDVIQHVLLPSELSALSFDKFRSFVAYPNPFSVLSRINAKFDINKTKISDNNQLCLLELLAHSRTELDLSQVDGQLLPYLIDALPLAYFIRLLKLSTIKDNNAFTLATTLMKEPSRLRLLEINGTVTNLDSFLNQLSDKPKLFSISFCSCEFLQQHLEALSSFMRNSSIRALEFHNAMTPQALTYFHDSFFTGMQLTSLSLDGTPGLYLSRILNRLQNLIFLSVADCKLEIGDFLLQLKALPNLRAVNLSGNRCSQLNTPFPPSIISLYANRVKWENGTLTEFFKFRVMKLSMSYAEASAKDWTFFYDAILENHNNCLAALIWDGNRIHLNLFKYLKKNVCLDYLSMNDCFNSIHPEYLAYLADFLDNPRMPIKTLSIRGTENNNLGVYAFHVVEAALKPTRLINLDIYGQNGGDQCLISLIKAIPKLRLISCDKSNPNTSVYLITLMSQANLHGIALSYPSEDIEALLSAGQLSQDDRMLLFSKCARAPKMPKSQPYGIEVYPPLTSNFNNPYQVFKYYPNDGFPRYFKKKELQFYSTAPPMANIMPIVVNPDGKTMVCKPTTPKPDSPKSVKQEPNSPKSPGSNLQVNLPFQTINEKDNSQKQSKHVKVNVPQDTKKAVKKPEFVFEDDTITIETSMVDETIMPTEEFVRMSQSNSPVASPKAKISSKRRSPRSPPAKRKPLSLDEDKKPINRRNNRKVKKSHSNDTEEDSLPIRAVSTRYTRNPPKRVPQDTASDDEFTNNPLQSPSNHSNRKQVARRKPQRIAKPTQNVPSNNTNRPSLRQTGNRKRPTQAKPRNPTASNKPRIQIPARDESYSDEEEERQIIRQPVRSRPNNRLLQVNRPCNIQTNFDNDQMSDQDYYSSDNSEKPSSPIIPTILDAFSGSDIDDETIEPQRQRSQNQNQQLILTRKANPNTKTNNKPSNDRKRTTKQQANKNNLRSTNIVNGRNSMRSVHCQQNRNIRSKNMNQDISDDNEYNEPIDNAPIKRRNVPQRLRKMPMKTKQKKENSSDDIQLASLSPKSDTPYNLDSPKKQRRPAPKVVNDISFSSYDYDYEEVEDYGYHQSKQPGKK